MPFNKSTKFYLTCLTLLFLTTFACSSNVVKPSRLPSGTAENPTAKTEAHRAYDEVIQRVLENNEIQEHFILKHDQIESAFIDSQYFLSEYDKLLDDSTAKHESGKTFRHRSYKTGIYPHLLALHFLLDQIQEQLTYEVGRFLELEKKTARLEEKTRIKNAVKDLINYLQYVPLSTRLALNPWAEQFASLHPELEDWKKVYRHLAVNNEDELLKLQQDSGVQKHLNYMISKFARKPGFFTNHLDDLAHTFSEYTEEIADQGAREPSSDSEQDESRTRIMTLNQGVNQTEPPPLPNYTLTLGNISDGPMTNQILATLAEQNTHVIFSVGGFQAQEFPETLAALKKSGMTIANFTNTQPELPRLEDDSLNEEISGAQDILTQTWGEAPRWFSPPYGAGYKSKRVQDLTTRDHLKSLMWTVDALDWADRQPARIVDRLKKQLAFQKRGVILFHLAHRQSGQAFSQFLKFAQNYEIHFANPGDL